MKIYSNTITFIEMKTNLLVELHNKEKMLILSMTQS